MKNIRIRVLENCSGTWWWYAIYDGKKQLFSHHGYEHKGNAIRYAKKMAKRIGISYNSKIIKIHGC